MRILAISDNFTGPEGFEEICHTFLVIVIHMVGGFDFNGNSGITDNRIDLEILLGMPIGKFLLAASVSKICTSPKRNYSIGAIYTGTIMVCSSFLRSLVYTR